MKVAMLGPIAWRTPPRHYGPWERVTSLLTEGLVRRGVDVTLFATADSVTSATLESVAPHGYAEDAGMDGRVWEALHVAHAMDALVGLRPRAQPTRLAARSPSTPQWGAPMVTTIHGFSGDAILPAYERARSTFVSISDADRSPALTYAATVHHGIDMTEFDIPDAATAAMARDDLVIFGRIHPDKGIADAIEIAARAGRRLVICGIVQDAAYFAEQIEPRIDGDRVVYRGSVGPAERTEVLASAAVLLHPIHFEEPFGLSVDRGDGMWNARGRLPARIDARGRRRRPDRFRRRRCRRRRRRGASRRRP